LGAQVTRQAQACVLDLNRAQPAVPDTMLAFLRGGETMLELARKTLAAGPAEAILIPEADAALLAPVPRPGKIICLGHNYYGHLDPGRTTPSEFPTLFSKPATTVCGPGAPIAVPFISNEVDFEAELAVVIGRTGRYIPEDGALDYVAGYTVFNDVSARDFQKRTSQWLQGKAFDTFGPMGPALVTRDEVPDPHALELSLTLNGVERQRANTRQFIFPIPHLLAYISAVMTLEPGDVIATGTPAKLPDSPPGTPSFMRPGDRVRVTIETIGTLENPVISEPDTMHPCR
jgi:acylpyruvate hydrolase